MTKKLKREILSKVADILEDDVRLEPGGRVDLHVDTSGNMTISSHWSNPLIDEYQGYKLKWKDLADAFEGIESDEQLIKCAERLERIAKKMRYYATVPRQSAPPL